MPDAAIPIFQTVNQNGEATLEVEAVIKALGLTMYEGFVPAEGVAQIRWLERETNNLREIIEGFANNNLRLATGSPEGESFTSELNMKGLQNGLPAGAGYIKAKANGYERTLIGLNEGSSWLQILGAGASRWRVNFGFISGTWPGGAGEIAVNVSHGMGVQPATALGVPGGIGGAQGHSVSALNNVTITLNLYANGTIPPAGTFWGFFWIAIG